MNHATYDKFRADAEAAGLTVNESNLRGPEHRYATVTCPCGAPGAIFEIRSKEGALVVQKCTAGCSPGTIGDALAFTVAPGDPSRERFTMTRLADVKPEAVEWIWPGWLPAGKLVTLDGDPGLGKSTLAIGIGAIMTTGGRWPDGTACTVVGDVLLMSGEDGIADTVRPRLDAAGADVTKVHNIDGVRIEADGTLRPPTLADVAPIERAIDATGARLLVVDVIMAFLPSGTDSHKDQDIRRVLSRLAGVADRTGCTVLLLRHLNKAKGGDPMYRGGGSIGIVGAARAGMLVAADPDDPERRVLA
ncbi:MAG: AAA family ATPase, partial [Mycobacterium sp.]